MWWELTICFLEKRGYELCNGGDFKCFHDDLWLSWYNQTEGQNPEGLPAEQWREIMQDQLADKYYLVSGLSERMVNHSTIWQNGKMVHDPFPTRAGLLNLSSWEYITPIIK